VCYSLAPCFLARLFVLFPLLFTLCLSLFFNMTTKVFVGNLSFKTVSDTLLAEFAVAGNVVGANIITRGPRSLGYGFVEMNSLDEAQKAVDLLNHKEIDGREINVEIARPRSETSAPEGHSQHQDDDVPVRRRRPRRRFPRGDNNNNNNNNTTTTTTANTNNQHGNQRSQGQPKRVQQYRVRQNQGNNFQQNDDGQHQGVHTTNARNFSNNNTGGGQKPRRRRIRNRSRVQEQEQGHDQQAPAQPQAPAQQSQPAAPRRRAPVPKRPRDSSSPSKNTIFVANLPFSVGDNELQSIFAEKFNVVKAHVVKKRNDRSKGFGFVEFATEEDQKAALAAFEKFVLHERELNVKVALTSPPGQAKGDADADAAAQPSSSDAATGGKEGGSEGAKAEEKGAHSGEKKEVEQVAPESAEKKTETETKAQ